MCKPANLANLVKSHFLWFEINDHSTLQACSMKSVPSSTQSDDSGNASFAVNGYQTCLITIFNCWVWMTKDTNTMKLPKSFKLTLMMASLTYCLWKLKADYFNNKKGWSSTPWMNLKWMNSWVYLFNYFQAARFCKISALKEHKNYEKQSCMRMTSIELSH